MSDESTVQLGYQELEDHNTLMQLIRTLIHRTDELQLLFESSGIIAHNESDTAHADIRSLISNNNTAADTKIDNLKTEVNYLINNINNVLSTLENRINNSDSVNSAQNDRLNNVDHELSLKIYDSDVSTVGHTGDFDDLMYRPNIVINDADGSNSGAEVKISKNRTDLILPATIKANIVGNVTGDVTGNLTGNASSATKLQTARSINGTSFDGSGNITTANWGTARDISIQDHNASHISSAVSVDGSGNVTLKLPSTINADISGNATTATKLQTAHNVSIQDHDAGHTGSAVSVDGSGNVTLKLPPVINADINYPITEAEIEAIFNGTSS